MISLTSRSFRERFKTLPPEVQALAQKSYRLWLRDRGHPSLHFKRAGNFWSARVGREYRALGLWKGDVIEWFWIGHHDEYLRMINQ